MAVPYSDEEKQFLREHYGRGPTSEEIADALFRISGVRRNAGAIQRTAERFGLSRTVGQRIESTPQIDDLLIQLYRSRTHLAVIATQAGRSREWCIRRAATLGLSCPRSSLRKPWSPEEAELLETLYAQGYAPRTIRDRLRRAGFDRSLGQIAAQRRRTGLGAAARETYSASEIATLLGQNISTVMRWIRADLLPARRSGASGNNDRWIVVPRALRKFLATYPSYWSVSRVTDHYWIVDLLTNGAGCTGAGSAQESCGVREAAA